MSTRLLLLNLLLVSAAVVSAAALASLLLSSPELPPAPAARAVEPPAAAAAEGPAARPPLAAYDVVAARSLFSPSRSEADAPMVPTARPFLYGVVLRDGAPTAFLEEPATKKVAAFKPGDQVAGGKLERIEADRVVIRRAEGSFEVLLRDPAKPRPVAAAPAAPPGMRAPGPTAIQPRPVAPGVPRPLPPTLFRRPQAPAAPPVRNAPPS